MKILQLINECMLELKKIIEVNIQLLYLIVRQHHYMVNKEFSEDLYSKDAVRIYGNNDPRLYVYYSISKK